MFLARLLDERAESLDILHVGWDGQQLGKSFPEKLRVDHDIADVDIREQPAEPIVRLHIVLQTHRLPFNEPTVRKGRGLTKRLRIHHPAISDSAANLRRVNPEIAHELAVGEFNGVAVNHPADCRLAWEQPLTVVNSLLVRCWSVGKPAAQEAEGSTHDEHREANRRTGTAGRAQRLRG